MTQFFHAADGTKLAYQDAGDGLPVLCLSGLTRNGTDFDYVAPHLSGVRLIRLDYRGRGQSAWADPATYTIAQESQDALALLDHLGIAKVAILGTSRGGLIAMTLAATDKGRLIGVCLNDVGPALEDTGLSIIKGYIGKNPAQRSLAELAIARARLMEGFEGVPDSRWMEEAQRHYIEGPDGVRINYDPDLARIFDTASAGGDAWPFFDALEDLPLALIHGANSNLLSAKTATQMQMRRPDMIYAKVPGRGHVPFLDEPESLTALSAWLEKMQ